MTASMTITKWEGRPFDDQALEKERKERMPDVVLVSELAAHYDREQSSFLKLLKRNDIDLLFTTDPISGQRKRCVPSECVSDVDKILNDDNKVISVTEALGT